MRRVTRAVILLAVASALLVTPRSPAQTQGAEACGPYALDFAFIRVTSPDDPGTFLAGKLGVVTPSFRLPWLVAAYRHLSSQPLTEGERTAVWDPHASAGARVPPGTTFGVQRWVTVSHQVSKEPETYQFLDTSAFGPSGAYYENCPERAFEHAAATLQARVASLGAADATIRPWIAAQEQVWANCGHRKEAAPQIPTPLDAAATPLARADRAYQIAAAYFYAGQWDAAVQRFQAIAADAISPWRPYGDYLAGRAFLRKGMIGGADGALDQAALGEAAAVFARVAADAGSPVQASAAGLKRFAELRRQPDAMRADVLGRLLTPSTGERFDEDLAEYRLLFLRGVPEPETGAIRAVADPLTDWIDTLRSGSPEAPGHAIARWREQGQVTWLVAALLRLPPGHVDEAALVAAARAVPASSPAYPTLAFHRARLLIRADRLEDARALAREMAQASAGWPVSAINHLRAIDLRLAASADAFFAAAAQAPVGFVSADNEDVATLGTPARLGVSADALDMLNERLPLTRLIDAAHVTAWPAPLRQNALVAAFTRALLLDDAEALRRLSPELRAAWPALGADLDALGAAAGDERRFVIARFLLRYPGLRPFMTGGERRTTIDWAKAPPTSTQDALGEPDGLRDNWWCALSLSPTTAGAVTTYESYQPGIYARSGTRLDAMTASLYAHPERVPWPDFLTVNEKARAQREWQALEAIAGAPDFLGREILTWAASHPTDPRLAEALHRVVRATRLGCTTDDSAGVSRDAFTALHKRFPGSEWAKKTPYWFR